MPSPGGDPAVEAVTAGRRRQRGAREPVAVRTSRSTTVATHQPVIASLRSSNSPWPSSGVRGAGTASARRSSGTLRDGSASGGRWPSSATASRVAKDGAKAAAARATLAVEGCSSRPARLGRDRRRGDAGHPARIDQAEVGEVDGHVEGDAVIAHAALDPQAECSDLARQRAVRVDPAAGVAVAAAGLTPNEAQVSTRAASSARTNGRSSRPRSARRNDRIRDELAGAVVGHLAAALDADDARCRAPRAARPGRARGPRPHCDRGSGPGRARAGAAGRRSRPPPGPPPGASGAPTRRGRRSARASAPPTGHRGSAGCAVVGWSGSRSMAAR